MAEEKKTVIQMIAGLTSLTERINEICGRTQIPDYSSIQAALKSSELWASTIKPRGTELLCLQLEKLPLSAEHALEMVSFC